MRHKTSQLNVTAIATANLFSEADARALNGGNTARHSHPPRGEIILESRAKSISEQWATSSRNNQFQEITERPATDQHRVAGIANFLGRLPLYRMRDCV
jgi:hypothetical protein